MVQDLTRARNRLGKFLLRHSLVYGGGSTWTDRHQRWLANISFEDKALASTFMHYRATLNLRDTALEAVEEDLKAYFRTEPLGEAVLRLGAYRGVTHMGALCLGAEVFDWRPLPQGPLVHELHRPYLLGALQRAVHPPGLDHPCRQLPHPRPTHRGGLVL